MANKHTRTSNMYSSFGEASSGIVSLSDGSVKIMTVFNTASTDRFLMLYDKATMPTVVDRPTMVFPVYAKNGYTEIGASVLTSEGLVFDIGLSWAMSTAPNVFNAGASTDAILTIRWA